MAAVFAPERILTQIDYVRITRLLNAERAAGSADALDELLALSELVASPAVRPDVVTMYSQVVVSDEASSTRRMICLCYPADADPPAGFISVLAPMGTALLGLRIGDVARWTGPGGESHAVRIVEMLFQPEASGDYTS
ncbi:MULTISPECIES: GreA/GreB family elongation factor [Ramlibacter]|uniref:Transcription elongation factor GreAB n=1 Tax=Ramlibacter pinisoli TaxID=2682844 RepID=A0A6N8IXL5_9BURK|nr:MULTISPECIES: GreA/GreB family elongation factor [Ramlibacter]MBA2961810.1 GreA/GreB family elongation factor [Ramlibacter sp. CGMCC 1.13660]MVQ31751.1 transcription elongation factor GreAB [Ramlibacter pinisoli]